MITLNYFDLGLRRGLEIDRFLKETSDLDVRVQVHGIEADPHFAEQCQRRFEADDRVRIHNLAIGPVKGTTDLYLDTEWDGNGSSIYADKKGVSQHRVQVPQIQFSEWMKDMGLLSKKASINVIKANIEGAEWDLIQDLEKHNLFGYFDLFCGPSRTVNTRKASRYGGWTTDMNKIPSLRRHIRAARAILESHGIVVHKYLGYESELTPDPVMDMHKAVTALMN